MSMWAAIMAGVGVGLVPVVVVVAAAVALVVLGFGYKMKKLSVQLNVAEDQIDVLPMLCVRLLWKMALKVQPLVEEMFALETQRLMLEMSVATLLAVWLVD